MAAAIQGADGGFLSASVSGGTDPRRSVTTGGSVNWPVSTTATHNAQYFSSASFSPTASGMSGGTDAKFQPETVYSYSIAASGGYDGVGDLKSVADSVTGNWSYGYDGLSRLTMASATSGPDAGDSGCWAYDVYGNRTAESYQTSACASPVTPTASYNAQNQVTWTSVNSAVNGFQYDGAGNVRNDNANAYLYDTEGRLCAVEELTSPSSMTGYLYDAEGNRAAKGTIASFSCDAATNGFHITSSYVLGLGGEQFAELDGGGNWVHTNVFAKGKLLATYAGADTYFALTDWLGSKRAEVTPDGQLTNYFSLPWGNGLASSGDAIDATEHHFTSQIHDQESGNEFFNARYYGSSMGRFLTPDPSGLSYADPTNPQSFNLYSYGLSNPLANIDPSELTCITLDDGSKGDNMDGTGCADAGILPSDNPNNDPNQFDPNKTQHVNVSANISQPQTAQDNLTFLSMFVSGAGPSSISYGSNDGATKDMMRTPGVTAAMQAYKQLGCPDELKESSGHFGPWLDGYIFSVADGNANYTEMQVGGYNTTFTRSGGVVNVTITNTASNSSLTGRSTWAPIVNHITGSTIDPTGNDNPSGSGGARHNIKQTFHWTGGAPCS
ncbi:MAG: RHS repeat-associated core domain-containing protein [Acidobacteriaceae bacterium]